MNDEAQQLLDRQKGGESMCRPLAMSSLADRLSSGENPILLAPEEQLVGLRMFDFKVLLLPDDVDERTSSGLWVPDAAREREKLAQTIGTVMALGCRAFEDEPEGAKPKIGEKIFFSKHSGMSIKKGRQQYRIVQDRDCCAIIDDSSFMENVEKSPRTLGAKGLSDITND